jgi:hypothetical protein
MQENISNKIDAKLVDKIISVAYRDGSITDKIIVTWKAACDDKVKNLLEEYRATFNKVRKLKLVDLPDYVIEKVEEKISLQKSEGSFFGNITLSFFKMFYGKAVPVAAAGIVILTFVSFLIFREPVPAHKYTKAEIELAEHQLKESLAIVGKVFTKAEKNFSQDILNKQLNRTLNKGYYLVNNILTGG